MADQSRDRFNPDDARRPAPSLVAATASPALLASDRERAGVVAALKQACVEGRLSLDEFGHRVELALAARTRGDLDALTRDLPAPAAIAGYQPSPVASTVAVLGETKRGGRWRIGERSRAIAVMGACKLDLRQAAVSAALTTIEARVVMGSLDVIVPEGVNVELEVVAVAASQSLRTGDAPPDPAAPVVRVTGWVLAGEVKVRDHA